MLLVLALLLSASPAHAQSNNDYCKVSAMYMLTDSDGSIQRTLAWDARRAPQGTTADFAELKSLVLINLSYVSMAASPSTLDRVKKVLAAWSPGLENHSGDLWTSTLRCLRFLEANLRPNAEAQLALSKGQTGSSTAPVAAAPQAK